MLADEPRWLARRRPLADQHGEGNRREVAVGRDDETRYPGKPRRERLEELLVEPVRRREVDRRRAGRWPIADVERRTELRDERAHVRLRERRYVQRRPASPAREPDERRGRRRVDAHQRLAAIEQVGDLVERRWLGIHERRVGRKAGRELAHDRATGLVGRRDGLARLRDRGAALARQRTLRRRLGRVRLRLLALLRLLREPRVRLELRVELRDELARLAARVLLAARELGDLRMADRDARRCVDQRLLDGARPQAVGHPECVARHAVGDAARGAFAIRRRDHRQERVQRDGRIEAAQAGRLGVRERGLGREEGPEHDLVVGKRIAVAAQRLVGHRAHRLGLDGERVRLAEIARPVARRAVDALESGVGASVRDVQDRLQHRAVDARARHRVIDRRLQHSGGDPVGLLPALQSEERLQLLELRVLHPVGARKRPALALDLDRPRRRGVRVGIAPLGELGLRETAVPVSERRARRRLLLRLANSRARDQLSFGALALRHREPDRAGHHGIALAHRAVDVQRVRPPHRAQARDLGGRHPERAPGRRLGTVEVALLLQQRRAQPLDLGEKEYDARAAAIALDARGLGLGPGQRRARLRALAQRGVVSPQLHEVGRTRGRAERLVVDELLAHLHRLALAAVAPDLAPQVTDVGRRLVRLRRQLDQSPQRRDAGRAVADGERRPLALEPVVQLALGRRALRRRQRENAPRVVERQSRAADLVGRHVDAFVLRGDTDRPRGNGSDCRGKHQAAQARAGAHHAHACCQRICRHDTISRRSAYCARMLRPS
ncbi:MAG: hypothetical protein IPG84_16820 [Betaproteobacteria bacterium]|nr:hypothetical protein [Betaproteobacteria bacterium]